MLKILEACLSFKVKRMEVDKSLWSEEVPAVDGGVTVIALDANARVVAKTFPGGDPTHHVDEDQHSHKYGDHYS